MPAYWRLSAVALLTALLLVGLKIGPTPLLLLPIAATLAVLAWDASTDRSRQAPLVDADRSVTDVESSRAVFSIVEASELPSMMLDGQLDVLAHNSAARELFPQIKVGEPLSPAVRNPELLNAAREAIKKNGRQSVEILNRIPFDRRLLATLVPVRQETAQLNGTGEPGTSCLLVQIRDLTEQTRLAQMRSDFIANASHELRTPLASLRGFIETLRGPARDDPEARDRFLGIMEEQALRMNRILDDLLSLSRIEMKAHLAPETTIDLREVLGAVARGLLPIAEEASIAINSFSDEQPLIVQGDRDELEQVFRNLVQNAIKYGHQGGKVDILTSRVAAAGSRPERIAISIVDDGPGISEEHLPRLTERFYRVDTSASRQRGGTGLGLAIVKHIVARHRGSLDIASQPGKGSTFTVTLDALTGIR